MYIDTVDPAVTYTDGRVKAGRLWLDTSTGTIGTLKKRNAANAGWDTLINLDAPAPVANDSVTNALLANMAQSTIKGRAPGAGTGDPTDLTATQATAILNAMVGDSGAGGTKGLVPAPAAGDTAAGKFLKADGTFDVPIGSSNIRTKPLIFIFDGGGSEIQTGTHGDLSVDFSGIIQSVTLLADQSGSIVIDIWKDTYANFPPTGADSITASAKPTISTASKSQDATLTGWTTVVSAGDVLRFNVDSVTSLQRVTLALKVLAT
jgi:hypothetical protein